MHAAESLRREALEKHRDFYASEDPELLRFCRLAARLADAPVAGVSWVGGVEQWYQCAHGAPVARHPRAAAPCDRVVRAGRPVEIPDLARDPEWGELAARGLRAYFGFPMIDGGGFMLGSFCLLDTRPRGLTDPQRELLTELCRAVVARIEGASLALGLERRLQSQASLARLGMVTGGLIHEIASPLTALLHRSSSARLSFEAGRADVADHLVRQEALASRILKIVAAVRGFAENVGELATEELTVAALVEQMLTAVQNELPRANVALSFRVPPELRLRGNAVMCVQILVNLFKNAVQAMDASAERWIEIAAGPSPHPGFTEIRFRDGGRGIDESLRQRIQQAFVSSKKERGGLGLGLTLSHGFAEQMGGRLELDPDRERTTFVLTLPAAAWAQATG